jgi:hypothetical protein
MKEKPDVQRVSRETVQEMLQRCAKLRGVCASAPNPNIQPRPIDPIVSKSRNDQAADI